MKYKNKKNGAIIDVSSEITGDWEPVEAPVAKVEEEKEPVKKRGARRK